MVKPAEKGLGEKRRVFPLLERREAQNGIRRRRFFYLLWSQPKSFVAGAQGSAKKVNAEGYAVAKRRRGRGGASRRSKNNAKEKFIS